MPEMQGRIPEGCRIALCGTEHLEAHYPHSPLQACPPPSLLAEVVVLVSLASRLSCVAIVSSIIQFLGYPVSCVSVLWRGEACWQKQRVTQ